jgi:RNA polymerase sigma-70 factor (ECF subfamily)
MDLPLPLDLEESLAGRAAVPAPQPEADAEAAVIARASAGDHEDFAFLVASHQEAVHRLCYRFLRDAEEARDATQDTFLRAWRHLDRFEPRGRFQCWLFRIALNVCRDRWKSKRFRQNRATCSLDLASPSLPCSRPAPDEALAQAADLERLRRGIDALPEKLRSVLILSAQEGLSHDACAEILGCSPRAVEGRLYRARRSLAAWWSQSR